MPGLERWFMQFEILDREVDPAEDGYDVVIRVDPSADERRVGRRFLRDERLLAAPPQWQRPRASADRSAENSVKAVVSSNTPADMQVFVPQP
jgi:hypothetical protein